MIRGARIGMAAVTCAAVACVAQPRRGLPQVSPPYVLITDTLAVFAFPLDTVDTYAWDSLDGTHYPGRPEFYWNVFWEPPVGRRGIDPEGLVLTAEWRTGGPRHGTLGALLAGRSVEVATWCGPCGTPAVTTERDSAVSYSIEGRQLRFVVRGADTIRRLFPRRPKEVQFARGSRDGRRVEWNVTASAPRP